jgi:hypothetical protein
MGYDVPGRRTRGIDELSEMSFGLSAVVDAANPQMIVHANGEDAVGLGLAYAAYERQIPLVTFRPTPAVSPLGVSIDALSGLVTSNITKMVKYINTNKPKK